jgi:annexin A7/11
MFDPKADADILKNAMKGLGNDKEAIINLASSRSNQQRLQIREAYKASYGTDLISDFKSELSGHLKDTLIAMFYHPIDYDCLSLRAAMKGLGTDEDTLIEIIATRPGYMIKQMIERYPTIVEGRNLVEDIKSETSGAFRRLLVSLLQGSRSDNTSPDIEECEKMAKELYEAGEKKWGTDDSVFNKIFSLRSPMEIACISRAYHKLTGHTILQAINNEFSGDIKKLLTAVVYAVISPSEFFATKVNKAIKGLGTNDKLLIRIMVTRNEIDMPYIRQYYKQLFKKDMIDDIKGDTSGDYRKLILKLAGA